MIKVKGVDKPLNHLYQPNSTSPDLVLAILQQLITFVEKITPMQAEAAAPAAPRAKKSRMQPTVPDYLVYEIDEGQPIYYRGYREVIKKTKTPEEIMGCSIIQSLLATLISYFVRDHFPKNYICLSNELGLKLPEKSRRNLDLAIFDKNKFADRADLFSNKYAQAPPEIVIEIDTKADLNEFDDPANYYHRKTEQLLQYGVGKIVWIFTGTRKYLFAEPGQKWSISNWSDDLELMPGIVLNIEKLLEEV